MANVLKDEKKQQIIALGRLGWSLRKIQEATRVRRETISAYLRGAGVEIWPPGRWKREGKAKPAIEVITGSDAAKPAIPGFAGALNFNPNPDPENLVVAILTSVSSGLWLVTAIYHVVNGSLRVSTRILVMLILSAVPTLFCISYLTKA